MQANRSFSIPYEILTMIYAHLPPRAKFLIATLHRDKFMQIQQLPHLSEQLCPLKAAKRGCVSVLDMWRYVATNNSTWNGVVDAASVYGQIEVLKWVANVEKKILPCSLINGVVEFNWTTDAVDYATINGWCDVLNWWKDESGKEMLWTAYGLNLASCFGNINMLEWWRNSGLELKFTYTAMLHAFKRDNRAVLQWWCERSGAQIDWNYDGFPLLACYYGSLSSLEYCLDVRKDPISDELLRKLINEASFGGRVELLKWLKRNFPARFGSTERCMDLASCGGHCQVLQWWVDNEDRSNLKWTVKAVDSATREGHVHVLQWWRDSGLKMRWSEKCKDYLDVNRLGARQWWIKSRLYHFDGEVTEA